MTKVTLSPESEELILTAAADVFASKGFKRGTVRDIAAACDMSLGAVASLGAKEQLLVRVVERQIAQLQSMTHSVEAAGKSAYEVIMGALGQFFGFFTDLWPLSQEYAAVLASGRCQSQLFPRMADSLVADFTAWLEADGYDEAGSLARSVYVAYVGSLFLWATQGFEARDVCFKQLDEAAREILVK